MKWDEQRTRGAFRYTVVPRTLVFLTYEHEILLLRGAPGKRLWAGKLNGLGGHVEPGEDPRSSARREVMEESGLQVDSLLLRAIVHVMGQEEAAGVMLFVFAGVAPQREVRAAAEGCLEWHPLAAPPWAEMVDDLPELIPRLYAQGAQQVLLYGCYQMGVAGRMLRQYA